MKIKYLTKEELWQLRQEVILNSIFIKDYENSFGIDLDECCSFFYDYVDALYMHAGNYNLDFFEVAEKYDNIENLYGFWCEMYANW